MKLYGNKRALHTKLIVVKEIPSCISKICFNELKIGNEITLRSAFHLAGQLEHRIEMAYYGSQRSTRPMSDEAYLKAHHIVADYIGSFFEFKNQPKQIKELVAQ